MSNMLNLFPNFTTTQSIFQKMVPMGAPWTQEVGLSMDIAYFTVYSGVKTPSTFTEVTQDTEQIAKILWDLFGKNWEHLWKAYNSEYNPIDNYNITESIQRDQTGKRTIDRTGTLSSTVDGTTTQTYSANGSSALKHGHQVDTTGSSDQTTNATGSSTTAYGKTVNVVGDVNDFNHGFNSQEQVPTTGRDTTTDETQGGTDKTTTQDDSTVNTNSTEKSINSGTDTTTTSDSSTTDVVSKDVRSDSTGENTTDDNTIGESITRTRSGNVGQNSYQELLNQEFELWKWNFFNQVFSDVDKILCLSVFDCCSI